MMTSGSHAQTDGAKFKRISLKTLKFENDMM